MDNCVLISYLILVATFPIIKAQEECQRGPCYPATGDLLVGRELNLTATSTCGVESPSKYCIVSFLDENEKCFTCNSSPSIERGHDSFKLSHLPKYMVTRLPADRLKGWWQAENGVQDVTIQLDLEAEFVFTHLIMTFKTFRPKAMYIERSHDYGVNYHVYKYFAHNCAKSFPGIPTGPQREINDVICEERYSKVEPSTKGEVVLKVLDPLIQKEKNPYNVVVQRLIKLTNLRVRFKELHTFGDDIIGNDASLSQKYYYGLYEMVVRGSCSCYGHAEHCISFPGAPDGMVHGKCKCTHNTEGKNCEMCKDGYHDEPWRPSYSEKISTCKKCNCNQHSEKCHFDIAVYNSNGEKSGGVCDNCQHNTHGRQCEQCKPLYFRDPFKNIYDPNVCKPCDCDPSGSIGRGECETVTDPGRHGVSGELGTIAGRCICKLHVAGNRCDRCKNGYWQLLESAVDGCKSCNCDPRGTIEQSMCDQQTGMCRCKRNVQGFTCSKCVDGFWSLGSTNEGCNSCDCDVGGSYSLKCDDISGNCQCRPHLTSRRCDTVQPGYYLPVLDSNIYEAEDAIPGPDQTTPLDFRKIIVDDDEDVSWTGDGFLMVEPGTVVDFTMITVPKTGDYKVVVRYDARTHGDWEDVRVSITREDGDRLGGHGCPVDSNTERYQYAVLRSFDSTAELLSHMCFVEDAVYNIQIDFKGNNGADGNTLVDSIMLVPIVDQVAIFSGRDGNYQRTLYKENNCKKYYLEVSTSGHIPEICKKLHFSISAEVNNGAESCNCDRQGTRSSGFSDLLTCDPAGGQCPCKPGVFGRRCDRCKTGFYGFGPSGCKACDCNIVGSSNQFCHDNTGQCSCYLELEGRKCDSCPVNHYGFPKCKPCECNNHSDTCDPVLGICIDCVHNTAGPKCERCKEGYYGSALHGTQDSCKKCQCPGGSSGNQFSNTCTPKNNNVVCLNCSIEYAGNQCEKCADGYFGNPLKRGGACRKCECNGNVDPFADGKCEPVTGKCLNCRNHASGDSCERCKEGYFGNAKLQTCVECVCNSLGTIGKDPSAKSICDNVSGQCKCLPNVVGVECNKCASGFYQLSSGKGCIECDCNEEGSLDDTCNQLDGQCKCRVGYGGRTCSECEDDSWGSPRDGTCKACDCNPAGSLHQQCDRVTGACSCQENVIGVRCDMCAARTSGVMPDCDRCHTCNDQWEDIVKDLELQITALSKLKLGNQTFNASEISAYTREIQRLVDRLTDIEAILNNRTLFADDVNALREKQNAFHGMLVNLTQKADFLIAGVSATGDRLTVDNDELDELERRFGLLKRLSVGLRDNITSRMEGNIGGGLNSTRESQQRSRDAADSVDQSAKVLKVAKKVRRKIRKEVLNPKNDTSFKEIHADNEWMLANMTALTDDLEEKLRELNRRLCATNATCGGCNAIGCNACGCGGGKVAAENALLSANETQEAMKRKRDELTAIVGGLKMASAAVNMSKESSDVANQTAVKAKEIGEELLANITTLIKDIQEFLNASFIQPNVSKQLAMETLQLNISLTPADVEKLADEIRLVVNNLTDVDRILNESKKDWDTAVGLKEEALNTKKYAISVMNKTQVVLDNLNEAKRLQNATGTSISIAYVNIKDASDLIKQLEEKLDSVDGDLEAVSANTTLLEGKRDNVKTMFETNKVRLREAEIEADKASELAAKVNKSAEKVREKYDGTEAMLQAKINKTNQMRARVQALLDNALKLFEDSERKVAELEDLRSKYTKNEERVKDLSAKLRELEIDTKYSRDKMLVVYQWHDNICNPDGTGTINDRLDEQKEIYLKIKGGPVENVSEATL